ncbi:uncharacterized protein [Primulina huaijiensis]|uniref:uncharacterized protein n=1 Tax=Primulina huaijiensis TaxID=1492673 RepID=UPI003CC75E45
MMDMNDGSESDVRSTISSSSRDERRRISRVGAENHRIRLMSEEKWDVETDAIQDKRSDGLRAKIALDFEYLAVDDEKEEIGFRRSKRAADIRNADISEINGFRRAQIMYNEGMRYSNEGSSNFLPKAGYGFDNLMRNVGDYMDELNTAAYAGRDRAVQLNEFDEQKDQSNKGKEKFPFGGGVTHPEPYVSKHSNVDTSLGMNRGALQHSHADSQMRRSSYQTQYNDPPPLMRRQEMGSNGYFPPQYPPSHDRGYGDPLSSQMLRENPLRTPALSKYQPSRAYIPERYKSDGMVYTDSIDTYAPNVSRHHPSCSCFQCHNKRDVPLSFQSSAYGNKFSGVRNDMMYNHGNHGSFGLREYNRRMSDSSSVRSQNPQSNARWPGDVKPEVNGVVRSRPQRVHLSSGGRHCCPIAGGAPFLMCHSCFELLQLPKKFFSQNSDRKKMRCGECSTVIFFTVSNKNLVVLIDDVEEVNAPVKVDDNTVMLQTHVDGRVNQVSTIFSSDDFDDSCFDFWSMDRELGQLSTGNGRDNKFMDLKNPRSMPDSENSAAAPNGSNLNELPVGSKGTSPPAGSLLVESSGYSKEYHGMDNSGESDKILPSKTSTGQISMNDSSPVTEIDISTNEYANTGTTFDSGDGSSRQGGRGAESFFAGFKNRIFKDSNKTNQTLEPEEANVTVNGHLISDRLIKKAERLAGPIHPGHYWYDFRAGFWGVMGGPCLGIIPPFIPEFHHHMPENCSSGNTRVYVNGRELCQRDLNLLGKRGMPTEREKAYILEISGRILDEDSGEELTGLGKLAPTVEKARRGFGMKDPNEAAQPTAV